MCREYKDYSQSLTRPLPQGESNMNKEYDDYLTFLLSGVLNAEDIEQTVESYNITIKTLKVLHKGGKITLDECKFYKRRLELLYIGRIKALDIQ